MDAYAALHPRQSADLRKALLDAHDAGRPLVGLFSGLNSIQVPKLGADAGYDVVVVDAEHTAYTFGEVVDQVQTWNFYSRGKTLPMVRVPNLASPLIGYALDAGAGGIMLPHTETADQARELVAKCLFPQPGLAAHGHRSGPPLAWLHPYHTMTTADEDITAVQNRHVAPIVQVESVKGVDNIDEILSVPGVGGCMIGIADLRIDALYPEVFKNIVLGKSIFEGKENERFAAMAQKVADACQQYRVPLMLNMAFDPERTLALKPALIWSGMDGWALTAGLAMSLAHGRAQVDKFFADGSDAPGAAAVNGTGATH